MLKEEVENKKMEDENLIQWPSTPPLKNEEEWRIRVKLVKTLYKLATNVEWLKGIEGKDTYISMPYIYYIDGLEVKFLPHWKTYGVGNLDFSVSSNVLEVVRTMKVLRELQKGE